MATYLRPNTRRVKQHAIGPFSEDLGDQNWLTEAWITTGEEFVVTKVIRKWGALKCLQSSLFELSRNFYGLNVMFGTITIHGGWCLLIVYEHLHCLAVTFMLDMPYMLSVKCNNPEVG